MSALSILILFHFLLSRKNEVYAHIDTFFIFPYQTQFSWWNDVVDFLISSRVSHFFKELRLFFVVPMIWWKRYHLQNYCCINVTYSIEYVNVILFSRLIVPSLSPERQYLKCFCFFIILYLFLCYGEVIGFYFSIYMSTNSPYSYWLIWLILFSSCNLNSLFAVSQFTVFSIPEVILFYLLMYCFKQLSLSFHCILCGFCLQFFLLPLMTTHRFFIHFSYFT